MYSHRTPPSPMLPRLEYPPGNGVKPSAFSVVFRPGQQLGDEELRTLIKERLRSSRVPEKIRIVDELPYNEMGKLLRREIRGMFQA